MPNRLLVERRDIMPAWLRNRWARLRAARGAVYLDRKVPAWADRIELSRLNVVNDHRCILAQTFGRTVTIGDMKALTGLGPVAGLRRGFTAISPAMGPAL